MGLMGGVLGWSVGHSEELVGGCSKMVSRWSGIVWCRMEWHYVAWNGVVLCGMERSKVKWHCVK